MADGLSVAEANGLLAAQFQGVAYSATGCWIQLHTGAPGSAGTSNVATNNTRMDASACFGTAPSGGSITNDAEVGPWASVPAAETYTHVSRWSASSGGTFLSSGTITTAAVAIGDSYSIPVGDIAASYTVAA